MLAQFFLNGAIDQHARWIVVADVNDFGWPAVSRCERDVSCRFICQPDRTESAGRVERHRPISADALDHSRDGSGFAPHFDVMLGGAPYVAPVEMRRLANELLGRIERLDVIAAPSGV